MTKDDQIVSLKAEVYALREALEPFVHYEEWMDRWADTDQVKVFKSHTYGDLRLAVRILAHPTP